MKFSISGFSQSDNKTIYMETPGVYYDDQLGVRVAIAKRHPKTEEYFRSGLNGPTLVRPKDLDEGYLHKIVNIDVLYDNPNASDGLKIPNPERLGQWCTLPAGKKMLVRYAFYFVFYCDWSW